MARRVFLLATWYPTVGQPVRGVFIEEQALALSRHHEVVVIAPELKRWREGILGMPSLSREVRRGLQVVWTTTSPWIPRSSGARAQAYLQAVRRAFRYAIGRFGLPDIVHAHVVLPGGWAAVALGRELGIPVVLTEHCRLIWLLSNSIASVLFPNIAAQRLSPRDAALRTAVVARSTLFASIGGATMLAFGSRLLIGTMYGPEFLPATTPLLLLLPGITLFAPVSILAAHLAGIGRPGANLLVSAVSFAATIVLDLALIPAIGMAGAAIASSVSYGIAALTIATIYVRLEPINVTELLVPSRRDLEATARAIRALRR